MTHRQRFVELKTVFVNRLESEREDDNRLTEVQRANYCNIIVLIQDFLDLDFACAENAALHAMLQVPGNPLVAVLTAKANAVEVALTALLAPVADPAPAPAPAVAAAVAVINLEGEDGGYFADEDGMEGIVLPPENNRWTWPMVSFYQFSARY